MALRFEIIGNYLVIADTSDNSIKVERPASDVYGVCEAEKFKVFTRTGRSDVLLTSDYSALQNASGTAMDKAALTTFFRNSLGFNKAGSAASTTTGIKRRYSLVYPLTQLKNALQQTKFANAPTVIVIFDDSTGAGFATIGNNLSLASWPGRLATKLNRFFEKAAPCYFLGTANFGIAGDYNKYVKMGAGWSAVHDGNYIGGGYYLSTGITAEPLDFSPPEPFDTYIPIIAGTSTASSIQILIDDIDSGNLINNSSAYLATQKFNVPGPLRTHKISFKGLNANNGRIIGCATLDSKNPGIIVLNMSVGGAGTSTFSLGNTNGPAYVRSAFNTNLKPNLYIDGMTINDAVNNVAIATQTSRTQTLLDQIRVTNNDVIFFANQPINHANFASQSPQQVAMYKTFSETYGYNFIDISDYFGKTWAEADSKGLMAESLHPNSYGYDLESEIIFDAITQAFVPNY